MHGKDTSRPLVVEGKGGCIRLGRWRSLVIGGGGARMVGVNSR